MIAGNSFSLSRPSKADQATRAVAGASNHSVLYSHWRRLRKLDVSGSSISSALPDSGKVNFYRGVIPQAKADGPASGHGVQALKMRSPLPKVLSGPSGGPVCP